MKLKAPKRTTTTLKMIVRKQKVVALKSPPPFTLKVPVNIAKEDEKKKGIFLFSPQQITARK